MKMSEQINELAKALAEFQGEVKQPEKTGVNPHFKSNFVTLDDTVKAIHSVAPQKGLSFIQMPVTTEQGVGVVTTIFHSSGQYIQFEPFILPLEKKTAQSAGSSITYAKRYALSAAFGLVSDEDDDGNEATGNGGNNSSGNSNGGSQGAKASDKQRNFIDSLLNKKVTDKYTKEALYAILKDQLGTQEEIENWTASMASKAIEILNGQQKSA